jgi:amicyanin
MPSPPVSPPRPRLLATAAVALALVLAAAGCGGGGDGGGDTSETTAPGTKGIPVTVDDFKYQPKTVTITAGETVTWTFAEGVPHNVKGDGLASPTLSKGKSWSYTFTKAGTYNYICTLHPAMKGTVEVS